MAWMARLSARSPPWLSRWRTVWPLLAGMGLVPLREAKAASLRQRLGWEKLTIAGLSPSKVGRRRTGLGGVTGWHICDGSRPAGGQASDQVNAVGQARPATSGTG